VITPSLELNNTDIERVRNIATKDKEESSIR